MKRFIGIFMTIVFLSWVTGCSSESAASIPIGSLEKSDGSYCWGELSWGMDIDTVEKTLGYALSDNANAGLDIEDPTDYRKDRYSGTAVFMEKESCLLFGAKGTVGYTFSAGAFKDVFITAYAEDHSQELLKEAYEQLLAELQSTYGEPTKTSESEFEGYYSVSSHWEGSEVDGKKQV